MRFTGLIKENVGFLHVMTRKGYGSIGTCFFVNIIEDDTVFDYIVTSKHVVEEHIQNGRDIFVRLNRSDKQGVEYISIAPNWVFHDDDAVDLAVTPGIQKDISKVPVSATAFDAYDAIITPDKLIMPLGEGVDVFFIGMFVQYKGYQRNFPMVRFGRLALVTNEPIYTEPYGLSEYYLVEAQAYPGNSGSPLYLPSVDPGGKPLLSILGVVQGFYPQQEKVYVDPTTLEVFTHFGISLATPARYIQDILEKEVLVKMREDKVHGGRFRGGAKPAAIARGEERQVISREEFLRVLRKASRADELEEQPDEGTSEEG